jgi:hypothetical protein
VGNLALTAGAHAAAEIKVAKGKTLEVSSVDITLVNGAGKVTLQGDNQASLNPGKLLLKAGANDTAGLLTVDGTQAGAVTIGGTANASNFLLTAAQTSVPATDAMVTKSDGNVVVNGTIAITSGATGGDASSGVRLGKIGGGVPSANGVDVLISGPKGGSATNSTIAYGLYVRVPNT